MPWTATACLRRGSCYKGWRTVSRVTNPHRGGPKYSANQVQHPVWVLGLDATYNSQSITTQRGLVRSATEDRGPQVWARSSLLVYTQAANQRGRSLKHPGRPGVTEATQEDRRKHHSGAPHHAQRNWPWCDNHLPIRRRRSKSRRLHSRPTRPPAEIRSGSRTSKAPCPDVRFRRRAAASRFLP